MGSARSPLPCLLPPPWWLLALALGTATPVWAQAPGTWAPMADLNQPRAEHTATLLTNGTVLIAGGRDAAGQPLASAEIYDRVTGAYTLLASLLPAPVWGHTATRLDDGTVLIAGGQRGARYRRAAQLFDPATDTFAALDPMSTPRGRHTATLLRDGRVVVIGGTDGVGPLASLEVYDPTTRTFSLAPSALEVARQDHTATLLPDGRVLVAGGSNFSGALESAELYDPTAGTVSPAGPLNVPRTLASAALLLDGTVLVAGGQTTTGEDLDSAEVYDAATNAFAWLRAPMGTARSGHLGVQLLNNGKLLISGGTSGGQLVPSAEVYDPVTGAFQVVDSPGTARRLFGANFFELPYTGTLLATGGLDGAKAPLASSEVLFYPTLRSDKPTYAPGETVTLMGEGWLPGETVAINIRESSGDPDTNLTVTADAQGAITNTEFQTNPNRSDVGVRFLVTASGQQSRWTAQAVFTDGNRTFDQCKDDTNDDNVKDPCVWINGSINPGISAYHEGDSVAFRIWLDGLTPGSTHTVTIRNDFTKQTSGGVIVLGYDYLTHPDATETATSQRCTDIPGPIGTSPTACAGMSGPSTITIPSDTFAFSSSLSGVNAALASQAVATRETANPALKEIVLFGGTLTGITSISKVGDPNTASDSQSQLTITFTVSSGPDSAAACTGPANNKNCRVNILFGGHLAKGTTDASGWGSGRGASSFPGSSISMRMHLIDGDSSGAVNRSIQPAAVIPPLATPTLTTTATPTAPVGGSISDTATLAGGSGTLGGTITFTLYGPNDATCGNAAIFTNPKTVVSSGGGAGTAISDPFTPSQAGTYRWRASYSGDTNNAATATACNDLGETSVVTQATPILTTLAMPTVLVTGSISDTATLAGGSGTLGGTITFTLYGPNDATCGNAAIFTNPKTVVSSGGGAGTAISDPFTPSQAGTYRWRASYSGDTNNAATATACNDLGETSVVTQDSSPPPGGSADPIITTVSCNPSTVQVNQPTTCTATVSQVVVGTPITTPTGTARFFADASTTAFATCALRATGTTGVANCSVAYRTPAVGVHNITASYPGDSTHEASTTLTPFPVTVVPAVPGLGRGL